MRVLFTSALLATLALTTVASADPKPQDTGAALVLFDQASAELDKKMYASACPKLEEVVRVVPRAIGAKLALAECYEGLGRVASAWSMWGEAQAEAASAHQPGREKEAKTRAQAIERRLPKLVIKVAVTLSTRAGFRVQRDGVDVGEAQWNVPLPIDPGSHKVTFQADGKLPGERAAMATEGATSEVILDALADAPVVTKAASTSADALPTRTSPLRTAGIVIVAVGGGALALGSAFGVAAIVSKGAEGDHCQGNSCDDPGTSQRNTTRAFGNVSTVGFVAGGILGAGGLTLLLAAPKSSAKSALVVSPSSIALRGSF